METIIELTRDEAMELVGQLLAAEKAPNLGLYKLRVCIEGDTAKFKVNEWTWTWGMGHLDPMCQIAQRRRVET